MGFGHWKLPGDIKTIPEDAIGFVYIITNLSNNKKYIGKKILENKRKRKPLKGRRNSRHYKVKSNWETYTGSSPNLNEDIEKQGHDRFSYEILSFHPSKLLLAYWETKTIIDHEALFKTDYYNEVLNLRIRSAKNKLV